jgi:hypothetical protein
MVAAQPSASIRPKPTARILAAVYVLLSYLLGLGMLEYGFSKIIGAQFQASASWYLKPKFDDFGAIAAFWGRFRWSRNAVGIGFIASH